MSVKNAIVENGWNDTDNENRKDEEKEDENKENKTSFLFPAVSNSETEDYVSRDARHLGPSAPRMAGRFHVRPSVRTDGYRLSAFKYRCVEDKQSHA
jgi:hypothetical protein